MRAREIQAHLRKRPFRPFRMHVSDGASYEVRHPELAIVARREVTVGVGGNGDLPERFVYLDPVHVTRIEPLASEAADPG